MLDLCFNQIRCVDVTLKDSDVGRALIEYANYAAIENLVLGASKGGFIRYEIYTRTRVHRFD